MSSTLIKDQEHDLRHLALYVQGGGKLTDAYKVEAIVYDASTGLPGTKVLPAVGDRLDLTSTGKFGLGSYGIVDPVTSQPWKPDAEIQRGRVVWYYTLEQGGSEIVIRRDFEVFAEDDALESGVGLALVYDPVTLGGLSWGDITIAAYRRELLRIRDLFEAYCRQHFRPFYDVLSFRGYNHWRLPLPEPLYGLESMTVDSDPYDFGVLRVSGAVGSARRNPKIEVLQEAITIFNRPLRAELIPSDLITEVSGIWGFVDNGTLSAPRLLRLAAAEEALSAFGETPSSGGGGAPVVGPVKRERTDMHEIEYAVDVSGGTRSGGLSLMSLKTRETLSMHRAPLALDAPVRYAYRTW